MINISLKEAINFAFKKVRDNFVFFLKLGTLILLMSIALFGVVYAILLPITLIGLLLPHEPVGFVILLLIFILEIIIPIFTFRVVSIINAGLIRISFKLINNESVKFGDVYSPQYFYSKLDEQTRKFSLFSGLLILLLISPFPFIRIFC
jgi:hypothetical protein